MQITDDPLLSDLTLPFLENQQESKKSKNNSSSFVNANKPSKRSARYENSLEFLTKRLMYLMHNMGGNVLNINEIATTLNVQKRRVYDVIHVLEGINIVKRTSKNQVMIRKGEESWSSDDIIRLQKEVAHYRQEEIVLDEKICELAMLNDRFTTEDKFKMENTHPLLASKRSCKTMPHTSKNAHTDECNEALHKYMHVAKNDILKASKYYGQTLIGIVPPYETKMELCIDEKENKHKLFFSCPTSTKPFTHCVFNYASDTKCDEVKNAQYHEEPEGDFSTERTRSFGTPPLPSILLHASSSNIISSYIKNPSLSSVPNKIPTTPIYSGDFEVDTQASSVLPCRDHSTAMCTPTIFTNDSYPNCKLFPPRNQDTKHLPVVSPETTPSDYDTANGFYPLFREPQNLLTSSEVINTPIDIKCQDYFMPKQEYQYNVEEESNIKIVDRKCRTLHRPTVYQESNIFAHTTHDQCPKQEKLFSTSQRLDDSPTSPIPVRQNDLMPFKNRSYSEYCHLEPKFSILHSESLSPFTPFHCEKPLSTSDLMKAPILSPCHANINPCLFSDLSPNQYKLQGNENLTPSPYSATSDCALLKDLNFDSDDKAVLDFFRAAEDIFH